VLYFDVKTSLEAQLKKLKRNIGSCTI